MYMYRARVTRPSRRSDVPVAVYGTSWCAASQRLRRHLDRLGIPFRFRDVDDDPEAARRVEWWTGGNLSHPTVQIGGQVLVEPTLDEVDWALSKQGVI